MAETDFARYLAEFVGTFMLVFTIGCNVLSGSPVWAATSIACSLTVFIYALGGVSGANFNPAVSLALGMNNKLPWLDVGYYIVLQIGAGISAAFCYSALCGDTFGLAPTKGFEGWQACGVEVLYTFMLVFVVLNVATSKAHAGKNQFYGIAIGFVIVAGGYGGGHISGGCFNPAVALGIDTVGKSAGLGFGWSMNYIASEILGAVMAAIFYRIVRPEDFDKTVTDYTIQMGKLLSEFLGTYFLVLTVGLNVLGGSPAAAFSIAASLMCMIFALGTVSGAHFNPAVTVAIVAAGRGKCSVADGAMYIFVQIAGGVCGAYTYAALENGKTFPLGPGTGFGWTAAGAAEVVFTFVLCYVVLSVATVKSSLSEYFGFAIGMCVTVGGYAIGAVSGGSLNPAVSVGISASHKHNGGTFTNCLAYAAFEIVGGLLAAGVFFITHPSEYGRGHDDEDSKA